MWGSLSYVGWLAKPSPGKTGAAFAEFTTVLQKGKRMLEIHSLRMDVDIEKGAAAAWSCSQRGTVRLPAQTYDTGRASNGGRARDIEEAYSERCLTAASSRSGPRCLNPNPAGLSRSESNPTFLLRSLKIGKTVLHSSTNGAKILEMGPLNLV